jgi:hypothetical protein
MIQEISPLWFKFVLSERMDKPNAHTIGAKFAGISCGTLLVLLANNLPDTYAYKSWFIIIAPSVAVLFTGFWRLLVANIKAYWKNRVRCAQEKKLRKIFSNALSNPNILESEKNKIQNKLALFEHHNIHFWTRRVLEKIEDPEPGN